MKFTKLRSLIALALGAVTMMTPTVRAATATDGDLFLGVRATSGTGSSKCYVVRIGDALSFKNATGPITINPGIGADLTTIFGANWKTRPEVFWGIAGGTGSFAAIGTDPEKTLYASREQPAPGTQSTPWQRKSDTTQGTTTSKMVSLLSAFNGSPNATATNSVSQTITDSNSWASFQPGGTVANSGPAPGVSFAAFNPSVEGTFTNGTAGSFLDLYRMAPATIPAEVNTNGDYVGLFIINDSGVLTFIPVAAFGASTVQLAVSTDSVSEDVASGHIAVTVNRTGDVSSAAIVELSTANGTASAGTDYTAITNQVISFGINETTKTVNVNVADRSGFQGDRTFTVSLNTPGSGVTIGGTSETVTIVEAIEPSTLQFSAATFSANQNDTAFNVTVTRTGGGSAVTVKISTAGDTAVAGTDFTGITDQTVNIPANTNSVNVPITLSAPTGDQANKQFTVTLSNPGANASLNSDTSTTTSTVRILANDTVAPTVAITAPAASATINGSVGGSVVVSGSATDAKGVEKVQVSLNGGAFADATLGGTPNSRTWSISIQAPGGLTSVTARSIDGRNNISTLATRSFTYVVKSALTVNIVGSGTVTGKLTGIVYEVGKTYTLTAVPANAGIAFDNWAGAGLTAPATEVAKLTFVFSASLAANPVITATFVNNPYAAANLVNGSYTGLIKAHTGTIVSNSTNGCVNVNVTVGTGAFSGTVKIGGESLTKMTVAAAPVSLAGVFDNAGVAKFGTARTTTVLIPRTGGSPYLLAMTLNTATKQITGTLTTTVRNGTAPLSDFTADRAAYSATAKVPTTLLNKAGTSGYYTAVLPARSAGTVSLNAGVTFATSEFPQGDGYTTISVTNAGAVTFAAVLGDGTVITSASALLTSANKAVFFASLYGSKGSIGGEVAVTKPGSFVQVSGSDFFWFRPYQAVQWYPFGWPEGLLTDLSGSEYNVVPSTSVVPGLTGVASPNTNIKFSDGLLTSTQSLNFNISSTNVVTGTGTTLGVVIAPATGIIGGAATTFFTHTSGAKTPFKGIIVQQGTSAGGWGHFLTVSPTPVNGLGESGGVSLMHN